MSSFVTIQTEPTEWLTTNTVALHMFCETDLASWGIAHSIAQSLRWAVLQRLLEAAQCQRDSAHSTNVGSNFRLDSASDESKKPLLAEKGGSSNKPDNVHNSFGEVRAKIHPLCEEGTCKCACYSWLSR